MRSWEELDPWELLGVAPDASVEDIRSAYNKLEQAFAPGSLALYSVADLEEQTRLQRLLRVAYHRLLRAAGATDQLGPEPEAPPPAPAPSPEPASVTQAPPVPRPTAPPPLVADVNAGGAVTGDVLRAVREGWGLSLESIAKKTRISRGQLAAIESEQFDALPARVFTRGFVMAYARELRLDPDLVWRGFERRWQASGPIPRPELPRL
jgi:flagellar biosynthesis protein FlhG